MLANLTTDLFQSRLVNLTTPVFFKSKFKFAFFANAGITKNVCRCHVKILYLFLIGRRSSKLPQHIERCLDG
ncbi:Uncharacterised protein [Vibrio cholerae]|nr:Uncharacterised protein [Vibrio cholerae]